MSATAQLLADLEDAEMAPERRCLVTGEVRPKAELIRFVAGPDGQIVPDLAERLPGRGLWLIARRDIVRTAVQKRLFQRAARAAVAVDADLDRRVEELLVRRATDLIGLARRAGLAVQGFAKVEAAIAARRVGVLVAASDGAEDGRRKLRETAPDVPLVTALSAAELGHAFGRENAVHAALMPGDLARALVIEAGRLGGFRAVACRGGRHEASAGISVSEEGTASGPR